MQALRSLLDSRPVRLILAVAIIVSVLPYEEEIRQLRTAFLALFGIEFLLRLSLFTRAETRRRGDGFFLVVDLLALLSFLPLEGVIGVSALRAFRVVRLLSLVRFTRELAADLYSVLTRREQLRQLGLVTAAVLALSFVAAAVLYHLGVDYNYNGHATATFWDRMWWSFRQVESPDNLVPDLHVNPVAAMVSLGLTITGIFVFSYLIGLGTNIVEQVVRAERRRPVQYERHTVVMGPVHESELLVREFVRIYEKNRALRRIGPSEVWNWLAHGHPRPRRHALPKMALLDAVPQPPSFLYDPGMRWVVYRDGDGSDAEHLERVSAARAKRAVFLSAERTHSDAITLSRLSAFRAQNPAAHAFVEVSESDNETLARTVGGEGTFVLDVSRFLGLFLCHHVVVPGIEDLLDELLSAKGSEFYTHLFVDAREHRALAQLRGTVEFADLARMAHDRFGVTLAGVFLGADTPGRTSADLVPVDQFRPWVNPLASPKEQGLGELKLATGVVPLDHLRGVFGIADTYVPLRQFARALLAPGALEQLRSGSPSSVPDADPETKASQLLGRISAAAPSASRVWIIGHHNAVRPLVDALAHFVEGVRVSIVVGEDHVDPQMNDSAQVLERDGHLDVHRRSADDLADYAAEQIGNEEIDIAVFVAGRGPDRDAINALRVLRFVERMPPTTTCRLLVELDAVDRAAQLRRHVESLAPGQFRLTVVSTEQIRNYFMVHSAFVPGVSQLYDRLLGHRGQELVYLPFAPSHDRSTIRFAELAATLGLRQTIPIAVRTAARVHVNPKSTALFQASDLRGVFAISDLDRLHDTFGDAGQPQAEQ